MKTFMAVLVLCAFGGASAAQTVYKCAAGGKVSYGERPCADGTTTTLVAPPAAADAKAAPEELARVRTQLAKLQKERAATEAAEARATRERERIARAAAGERKKCERLRLKQRWAQDDLRRAGGKATEAMGLKAQRQAEALAVECPG